MAPCKETAGFPTDNSGKTNFHPNMLIRRWTSSLNRPIMVSMKSRLLLPFLIFFIVPLSGEPALVFNAARESQLATLCEKILNEAYARTGRSFILTREYGFDTLQTTQEGRVDGELYRIAGIEQQYDNLIPVPVALIELESIILTKGLVFPVAGPESLRPYRVGILQGVVYMENLTAGLPRENIHRVAGEVQLFQLLASGRVDAIIEDRDTANRIISEEGLVGITPLSPPLAVFPIHHYLHKKHSDFVPALTETLAAMEAEGRLEELRDEFRRGRAALLPH